MNTFKKCCSRQFYRTWPFWLLFSLSLYSVLGFYVLPKVIYNTLVQQVSTRLGWQTSIQKVQVNPFLFTLTITDLKILEGQSETIALQRFHADFELRSIIEGAYTFKNIELIKPIFNLSIAKDGITNIQKALTKHRQTEKVEQIDDAPFVMPKLLFDNISVKNGALSATDHSQSKIIKHQLNPISFNLDSFSTYVEKGGQYKLHISLGNNQSLDWSGQIAVAPLSSQGAFNIKGIRAEHFWPYVDSFSPYALHHSDVNLKANYALSFIDNHFQLTLDDAFVTLNEIKIALKSATNEFINIKQIKIGPTDFDLNQQSVAIKKVIVDTINLDLLRNKLGKIEQLSPLDSNKNSSESTSSVSTSPPFFWSINDIVITNSQVNFTDKSLTNNAKISIHHINASLLQLNHTLSNKQPFSLSYQVEASNENRLSGDLIAQPFKLNSEIKLSNIALNIVQPYLSELAHVTIKKGSLSLTGKAKLTMHKSKGLQGAFTGDLSITDFDSRDTLIKRRLLGWEALKLAPIKVTLLPLTIDIDKVILDKPYSRLVITQGREINFSQLMKQKAQKAEQKKTPSNEPAVAININQIDINSGSAYFADLSLHPQFGTSIQNLNGVIKGLTSDNLETADVNIKGTVEEYGKVLVVGKINPLSGDLYTDININFDKIELTTLTPYAGRYAGYVIDKGKLSLALNYKISKGYLDGQNRLILDQFELGEAVESDESLDLPIKLALALFKDSDGVIDISLPTKGDINSPDFEFGGLIMKPLLNIISKAVTAPFTLLANLVGSDEDALNSVEFNAASVTLNQQQKDNLSTLATLLKKRPQLILDMRVHVDSEHEGLILKQQAVSTRFDLTNKTPVQQISVMEDSLIETQGKTSVETLKTQLIAQLTASLISTQDAEQEKENEPELDPALWNKQYQKLLFEHLVAQQLLRNLDLTELAQQRIAVIKHQLIKVNNVDNSQIFALNPSLNGKMENATISTVFNLSSK